MLESELNSPKIFSSHSTTAITTTAFRIDLMELAMGMKRSTSHRRTPTTMRTRTTCSNGMFFDLSLFPVEVICLSALQLLRSPSLSGDLADEMKQGLNTPGE
jgi:hypothetical protein